MTQSNPSTDLPWEEEPKFNLATPMSKPEPPSSGPLSSLDQEQRARVAAMCLAAPWLTSSTIGGKKSPDVSDLIQLSEWVVKGEGELYPFAQGDGSMKFGPDVVMQPDGYVNINGVLYVEVETEETGEE